jgi:toxin secretion/phage lysis holin
MAVDYITGMAVALVFHKSKKTQGGGASSKEGFKGIVKKICMLLLVGLAHELDVLMGTDYVRATAILFFTGNEGLSVLENMGLMGIRYPAFLEKALEALKDENGGDGDAS